METDVSSTHPSCHARCTLLPTLIEYVHMCKLQGPSVHLAALLLIPCATVT